VIIWCTVADDDDDVMMSDWLDMVEKKNELVREESELIYRLASVLIITEVHLPLILYFRVR